ncbi:MAG: hypothetical protein JWP46_308 [Modestobacter sp.]|nr:hypothetical protein [Modestobacter sp.]
MDLDVLVGEWSVADEGFHQRFTGTFSDDRTVVHGTWETSPDGVAGERDFDLVHRRRTD